MNVIRQGRDVKGRSLEIGSVHYLRHEGRYILHLDHRRNHDSQRAKEPSYHVLGREDLMVHESLLNDCGSGALRP